METPVLVTALVIGLVLNVIYMVIIYYLMESYASKTLDGRKNFKIVYFSVYSLLIVASVIKNYFTLRNKF